MLAALQLCVNAIWDEVLDFSKLEVFCLLQSRFSVLREGWGAWFAVSSELFISHLIAGCLSMRRNPLAVRALTKFR